MATDQHQRIIKQLDRTEKLPPKQEANIKRRMERKRELLAPHAEGSDCLHLGFVGDNFDGRQDYWLHGWLDDVCDSLTGVDIQEDAVDWARRNGYDAHFGNVEDFDLGREFDVLVATDILEHVTSPGLMLDSARDHARPGAKLLLTTPRTHTLWNLAEELRGGIDPSDEHKMWYCRETLTRTLEMHGWNVEEYRAWGYDRRGTTALDSLFRLGERLAARAWDDKIQKWQHFIVATPSD